jgi:hypothetical protein
MRKRDDEKKREGQNEAKFREQTKKERYRSKNKKCLKNSEMKAQNDVFIEGFETHEKMFNEEKDEKEGCYMKRGCAGETNT